MKKESKLALVYTVIVFFAIWIILYLAFSFIDLDINFQNWQRSYRVTYSFAFIMTCILFPIVYLLIKDETI